MFIDTHAHLYDDKFEGRTAELITLAKDYGVDKIICSASDLRTAEKAVELSEKFDGVYATIGIHPQDAGQFNEEAIKVLRRLANESKKVVGIGEIGMEEREGCPDVEVQKRAFGRQIELARELTLPIVIHSRDAIADTLKVLKKAPRVEGTFHCFSESYEVAKIVLGLGLHISVGGVVTFKNGRKLQEIVPKLPLDRLLLETDCPYLAPEPHRGSVNQPAYIPLIAEKIAALLETSVEEIARATTLNARRLFKI